jgi:hemoglobin
MTTLVPAVFLFDRLGGRTPLLRLLPHFYADVRQHREIARVFTARITEWPAHLEKIAAFWYGATGGPSHYMGPMPTKHISLGLEERHFQAWHGLWSRHCHTQLTPAEAEDLSALAESIAQRFSQIIMIPTPPNG